MTNPRSCKKCGHLHPEATHAELEACPKCGAIYSRVEAAIKEGRFTAYTKPAAVAPQDAPTPPKASSPKAVNNEPYIKTLRNQTNYPNFRAFVNLCTGLGYLVAAVCAIGAILALTTGNMLGATVGICAAIFIVVVSKFGKESFSMLADLSDSAAIIAENSSTK